MGKNKIKFGGYKRTQKREPKHICAVKGETFSQHHNIEAFMFKMFNENPHLGEVKRDGKSTLDVGKSWYYVVDCSGELKRPVRIRLSDHICGWKRHKELVNIIIVDKEGNQVPKHIVLAKIKKRIEMIIEDQSKEE